MALGKLEELKEEVLVKDETTVLEETTVSDKTIGETIQERFEKIAVERAKKTEELFEFIRNLYLDNSRLVYMRIRIADITAKGLYPERAIELFDRKGNKLTFKTNHPKDNNFVDFEGNDFDNFVSMMDKQGMKVLFDASEIKIKNEPVKRLFLCVLPVESTLEEYYVNKIFGKSPYKIAANDFYDMISEDAVYIPEDDEVEGVEDIEGIE